MRDLGTVSWRLLGTEVLTKEVSGGREACLCRPVCSLALHPALSFKYVL